MMLPLLYFLLLLLKTLYMRCIIAVFLALFLLVSCKKERVDASTTKNFQESINDMASKLPTLKQIKFNEALYILKTFGVEGENDIERIKNLGQMLNGKNVAEILQMADQVAQKNEIAWSSTAPPTLGEMNIFGSLDKASEYDPNDIKASTIHLNTSEIIRDSVSGAIGLKVVPRLVDEQGKPIEFSQAGLEVVMEVHSGGSRIYSSKNLMRDNEFDGFTIKYSSFSVEKIVDNKIDVSVEIKTTKKAFKKSKMGILVNSNMLAGSSPTTTINENENIETVEPIVEEVGQNNKPIADPKSTVSKFLSNLSAKNFKGAYDVSDNPNWGSYDKFSNPISGFGNIKAVSVKKISSPNIDGNSASVNATYDIEDKDGKSISLDVTFSLKNINGEWKISNYQIN